MRRSRVANAWYIDRTRGCGIFRAKLTVRDARTGREIGGITYLITGYHFTARDARTWAYQVQLMEVSRWGTGVSGTTRQVGCVNPGYIPVISHSTTGPWPELAKHIRYARDTRRLPGKFGTSRYLTRLTDTAKIKKNRKKACPSSRPRPAGESCDEYPFASTRQGARTGDGKYSRRMINETQNTEGGRALNGFYTYSRILEKDKFLVWIR